MKQLPMMILQHSIVKETFIYTATDMVGKAMSFILLPLVSFYMPPNELGIATNFTVLSQFVVLLAGQAIVNGLPYFYYEQSREENNLLVSNLLFLCSTICLIIFGVSFLFRKVIYGYLQLDYTIQLLTLAFVYGSLVSQMSIVLLRLENKARSFAYLQIAQILFHALMVVLFVIVLKGGGTGKIYAEVAVFGIMGGVHMGILYKKGYLKMKFCKYWIKTLLKFGIPLLPHSISFWFKGSTDKIFITHFCGLQFNGLYSMAISVSSIYTMLVNSFFSAYIPYLQKQLAQMGNNDNRNAKSKIVAQTYILYFFFFLVSILAVAGSWILFEFFIDSKYKVGFTYTPLIILSCFIYSFYHFAVQYVFKAKRTLVLGGITFTGSIIQVVLSFFLIQLYGVMGAVYSLLIGNLLVTCCVAIYSNIVYPMPWLSYRKDNEG